MEIPICAGICEQRPIGDFERLIFCHCRETRPHVPAPKDSWEKIRLAQGVLVPGGFGGRGIEGKIACEAHCRETKKPFLGISSLSASSFIALRGFGIVMGSARKKRAERDIFCSGTTGSTVPI